MREAVHLLRPADRDRDPAGPVPRLGIAGYIDDRETAEVLLGLGKRPVGEDGRAAARVDAAHGGRRVQASVAEDEDTGGVISSIKALPDVPLSRSSSNVRSGTHSSLKAIRYSAISSSCSRAARTTTAHLLDERTRVYPTPRPRSSQTAKAPILGVG